MAKWTAFPYASAEYTYDAAALKKQWARLHAGDAEPLPKDDKVLAAWALFSGIFQMVAAWRLRAEIRGEFWLGCAGVLSFLFGVLLLLRPGAGALALVWMIASFSVLYGIVLIAWGLHLRRLRADGAQAEVQLRIRQ